MVTGEQIKAARTILRLSQRQFAEMVHITPSLLKRIEGTRGDVAFHPAIVAAITTALEAAGVELIDPGAYSGIGGPGVRLKGEVVAENEIIEIEPDATPAPAGEIVAKAH